MWVCGAADQLLALQCPVSVYTFFISVCMRSSVFKVALASASLCGSPRALSLYISIHLYTGGTGSSEEKSLLLDIDDDMNTV